MIALLGPIQLDEQAKFSFLLSLSLVTLSSRFLLFLLSIRLIGHSLTLVRLTIDGLVTTGLITGVFKTDSFVAMIATGGSVIVELVTDGPINSCRSFAKMVGGPSGTLSPSQLPLIQPCHQSA